MFDKIRDPKCVRTIWMDPEMLERLRSFLSSRQATTFVFPAHPVSWGKRDDGDGRTDRQGAGQAHINDDRLPPSYEFLLTMLAYHAGLRTTELSRISRNAVEDGHNSA